MLIEKMNENGILHTLSHLILTLVLEIEPLVPFYTFRR